MNSTFYTLKYSDIPIFRIPNIVHILYYIDDKIFIIKLKIAKIYNVQKSSSGHRLSKGARGEKIARSTNFCMFPQCKMWNSRVTQNSSLIFINLKEEEIKISTNIKYQYTGCPNKHGNSVTNSISSFKIILWFSIVIPTEKAVICKSFVCYVYILFVYVLTAYGCT